MESMPLSATVRSATGKGAARKIRVAGALPAVVYRAGAETLHVSVSPAELEAIFRRSRNRNTLVGLDVDGGIHTCLVKEVQRHPVSQVLRHVDFFEVNPNAPVQISVRVNPVGTAVGTKLGGKLQLIMRELDVACLPGHIPATLDVDVTDVDVNQYMKVGGIKAPDGCTITSDPRVNLLTVVGKKLDPVGAPEEAPGAKA